MLVLLDPEEGSPKFHKVVKVVVKARQPGSCMLGGAKEAVIQATFATVT